MQGLENSGLSLITHKDMNALKLKIVDKEKELKRKKRKAVLQKGYRGKLKQTINAVRSSKSLSIKNQMKNIP